MHLEKMAKVARQQKKEEDDGAGEDNADQAFGEHVERDNGGHAPAGTPRGIAGLPAVEKKVERDADPQSHGDVWDHNAREEIRPCGRQEDHRRPEAGLRREESASEKIKEKSQEKHAEVQ